MEITRENLIEEITKKFNEIEKLWNISDKDWKNLPDEEKQLFYAKEKEIERLLPFQNESYVGR